MSRVVALLPMKAHSERIPGKNFRHIAGKPLFQWVLDSLLAVPAISQVVINTDGAELLREQGLVESERVRLRQRRPGLCGDFVSMNLVLADDIESIPADVYLMTHATNPLISPKTFAGALQRFGQDAHADSLFSVTRHNTRFYRADGSAVNHEPQNLVRTQDLEPWFEENSCIYLFTRAAFAKNQARIGAAPILFEVPKHEAIDIDEPEDWAIAQSLLAHSIRPPHAVP